VKKHHQHQFVKLPKETPAFFCATCGAVSLDAGSICKVGGSWRRADWCGIKDPAPPRGCANRVHNVRWVCGKCGKVAVNPELLCRPEEMPRP
jgi:ribosomal protein S27AE